MEKATANAGQATYTHREAFCLMQYRDEVTGEIEILWNSRDGVTPFGIRSKAGNTALHVNWQMDIRYPNFVPVRGMRVFIDALPEQPHIRASIQRMIARDWHTGLSNYFESKEHAFVHYIGEWTKPGKPTVVTATGEPGRYEFPDA